MWIKFNSSSGDNAALKVGVGKINAITGKPWKSKYIANKVKYQNYCAIPKQPWLDGINAGKDMIRQFVAMPLGQGYTVEAQVKKMLKEKKDENEKADKEENNMDQDEAKEKDHDKEGDANGSDKEKDEEDFETVGGIQIAVYPRFNENIHISEYERHYNLKMLNLEIF